MAIRWKFTPPAVDARLLVNVAADEAAKAGAEVVLEAAQPNVPVEYGTLRASGRVVSEGHAAHITYGYADDGTAHHAPSNQYVVKQHEDGELNHPNGGTWKWLETAMHTEGERIAEVSAGILRKVFG